MLKIKDLSKKSGGKTIVDNLNIYLPQPSIWAIVGKSDYAKTSVARMIAGIMKPDSGAVFWNDTPLNADGCRVGYLPKICGLYEKIDILTQLKFFAELKGLPKAKIAERLRFLAEETKITDIIFPENGSSKGGVNRTPFFEELENDEKFRIMLAVAMLDDPDLIILDEPTETLTEKGKLFLKKLLKKQKQFGKYIVFTTADSDFADSLCTDITVVRKSKTVLSGNLEDIKKSAQKIHLTIETDGDISEIAEDFSPEQINIEESKAELILGNENEAENLLVKIIAAGITVRRYEVTDLSLREIIKIRCGDL